jgi:prevent-host-death family protein
MQPALEAIPLSELITNTSNVIQKIAQRPMLLTQNGRSVAVLVSPEEWNRREQLLAERRFTEVEMRALAKAYQKMAGELDTVTMEEHKARMAERYGYVASKA